MKCTISSVEANTLHLTSINGVQCFVLPRFVDLQTRLDFIDANYVTKTGIKPSSKIFEFAEEIFHLVRTAEERFPDNPKAAHIFRIMLSEDLFDDEIQLFAVYTRWLEESGY